MVNLFQGESKLRSFIEELTSAASYVYNRVNLPILDAVEDFLGYSTWDGSRPGVAIESTEIRPVWADAD